MLCLQIQTYFRLQFNKIPVVIRWFQLAVHYDSDPVYPVNVAGINSWYIWFSQFSAISNADERMQALSASISVSCY